MECTFKLLLIKNKQITTSMSSANFIVCNYKKE